MTNETHRARTERKRAEAIERQAAYEKLSLAQKTKRALERGGPDCRQYKRLKAQA